MSQIAEADHKCGSCGATSPVGMKFCGACGKPIVAVPPPIHQFTKGQKNSFVGWFHNLNKRTTAIITSVVLFLLISVGSCGSPSVDKHLTTVVQSVNTELSRPGCDFGKQIENSHLTVTYKTGNVTGITAKTIDGSKKAGRNGSNISEITMVITAHWEGKIQTGGFTEVEIVYDNVAKKVKSSRHVKSNALIDLETVDWVKVGYMVGAAIASSAFN